MELHVAVGVIHNPDGAVLVARRHEHLHQGGLWEFPGGKLEPGETARQALRRELHEELGISVEQACPLIKIHHDYPDRRVLLDVWRVGAFSGNPQGLQGQPIRWVSADELLRLEFPAANRPIVAAARLPDYYPIVDGDDGEAMLKRLEVLAGSGYPLAQLRAKKLDERAYRMLAERAVEFARPLGMSLLLNGDPEQVRQTGAAGVHLTAKRLMTLRQRPLPEDLWVAASCHGTEELLQAKRIGVDFAVLSPVLATPSHAEVEPLGWPRFGALMTGAQLPVFALGGMTPVHLAEARRLGAQGIAGIRGFAGG
ncbi:MAG: Nudix family hydrolase [Methylococcaceae bacterium]|nr:Nudix family hydrolase [Methylococcaceae bacterium]